MLLDDADASPEELAQRRAGNLALTILATDLSYTGNDDTNFQGNYDYDAHAQVYTGGADPLGSQGYASVIRHPSSSWTRPAKLKARARFYLLAASRGEDEMEDADGRR